MIERLRLSAYNQTPRTAKVEYVPRDHWRTGKNRNGGEWKAYDVIVDGVLAGKIEQTTESTDRIYNRIRVPGRGRLAWSWRSAAGKDNYPGLYARTRRHAVADMLGYDSAQPV